MRTIGVAASLLALLGCSGGEAATDGASAGATSSAGQASAAGGSPPSNGGRGGAISAGGTSKGGASSGGSSGGPATGDITCRVAGDGKSTITLINHCATSLTFAGSRIMGGELQPGEHACRDVGSATEAIDAIRYWAYAGADPGGEKYTLAELTLNTDFNDFDWYNISHVDASNLPMRITAVDMPKCRVLTCAESLIPDCPPVGQLKDASGKVVSCVSPDRNDPNSVVAKYFEAKCKDAYSWSGDDADSVVACAGEDYDVTFCP